MNVPPGYEAPGRVLEMKGDIMSLASIFNFLGADVPVKMLGKIGIHLRDSFNGDVAAAKEVLNNLKRLAWKKHCEHYNTKRWKFPPTNEQKELREYIKKFKKTCQDVKDKKDGFNANDFHWLLAEIAAEIGRVRNGAMINPIGTVDTAEA